MAHSPKHYTEMGRLDADAGKRDWDELTAEYGAQLPGCLGVRSPACTLQQAQVSGVKGWAPALSTPTPRGSNICGVPPLVVMGFLKNHLSSEDTPEAERSEQELLGLIVDYRQGLPNNNRT